MVGAPVPGKRLRGRKINRWKDSCKRHGKCGIKGGGRTGQNKVEERYSIKYPRWDKSTRRKRRGQKGCTTLDDDRCQLLPRNLVLGHCVSQPSEGSVGKLRHLIKVRAQFLVDRRLK